MKVELEIDVMQSVDPALFRRITNLCRGKPFETVMPILLTVMTQHVVAEAQGDEGELAQHVLHAIHTLMRSTRLLHEMNVAQAMSEKEGAPTQ